MQQRMLNLFSPKTQNRHLRRKADALRDAKDWHAAAVLYASILDFFTSDGPLHVQCGHMFKESGDLVSAERYYMAALSIMPHDADLQLQLGHFYKVAGRTVEAMSCYFKAIQMVPGWTDPIDGYLSVLSAEIVSTYAVQIDPGTAAGEFAVDISKLFDAGYYARQYGIASDGVRHYQETGWKQGFNPHPLFDTEYYIRSLGRPLDGDPLTDFGRLGMRQLAEVHPLLDVQRYSKLCAGLKTGCLHPLLHYLWSGGRDRIDGFRLFDQHYYLEQCPALEPGLAPLVHYLRSGWKEGHRPHRHFTPEFFSKIAELDTTAEPLSILIRFFLGLSQFPMNKPVDTSIIILNLSKSMLTLQCIYVLYAMTDMQGVEVIVFDNGSTGDEFWSLARFASCCRILRSEVNLGFGEANNVAAEHATGRNLVFLNNDAFVTRGWLPLLIEALAKEGVGAAGPMFVYPDGTLQEAGATVTSDGHVHQHGRGLIDINSRYRVSRDVDYISAATLAMPTALFRSVLGFDLMWDPAYYEDVDLCLKIRLAGKVVRYQPAARVRHLENSTSSDINLNLRLHNVVAANRVKFVQRWGDYLNSPGSQVAPTVDARTPSARTAGARPLLALFTPYPLTPGGGERYLLSLAHVLRDEYECVLYTPQPTSRIRLLTMGRELGLDLDHVSCLPWAHAARQARADIFVSIGNEILPYAEGIGAKSFFICQFPFPLAAENYRRDWGKLATYDGVILYSQFVQQHYSTAARLFGQATLATSIINPPVEPVEGARRPPAGVRRILNVGRFHPGGHCKRQDVMIEAFRHLLVGRTDRVELHLAGSLGSDAESRDYFSQLQVASKGLPIHFHVNSSMDQLSELFLSSDTYWHATGISDEVMIHPERFEHFGITILEAMSAGAIPVSVKFGGPSEIITHGEDGYLIGNVSEMVAATTRIFDLPPEQCEKVRLAARTTARRYSPDTFKAAMLRLFS